jgi:hypothetical protein
MRSGYIRGSSVCEPDSEIVILRRFVALILLLVVSAFQAEAGIGAMRDGDVHHESLMAAMSHQSSGGFHGHEDAPVPGHAPGSPQAPGGQHHHGTTGDHCTHQHLVAPVSSLALTFSSALSSQAVWSDTGHFDRVPRTLFHPPRA